MEKLTSPPCRIFAKDYRPPAFLIPTAQLEFLLDPALTLVTTTLTISKNPQAQESTSTLYLDGVGLELVDLALNHQKLAPSNYTLTSHQLIIPAVPDQFLLTTRVKLYPEKNLNCTGLFLTQGNFCTHNEPHGFRTITYFLDRPDILTKFTTTIQADRRFYPVLLSNGNLIHQKQLAKHQHLASWEDPFPKSSYLFALAAGNFQCLEESYLSKTGRSISLKIYTQPKLLSQCEHALKSLKQAMAWEEKRWGLEYDLDLYQIVGIDDFNMGAMENKGLNIFNNRLLLAHPDTATDEDFKNITATVAHEYFHNWTGNRVTCRDWFQLGLKEGLTTLRETLFMEEHYGYVEERIATSKFFHEHQFPSDSGPLAHPIRLTSYIEVDNFYTSTVYQKSAEVFRMLWTHFGPETFRQILTTFLTTYDGQAATIDNFLEIVASLTSTKPNQFRPWFDEPGTPLLRITDSFQKQRYHLEITQSHPRRARPFWLPFKFCLVTSQGYNHTQQTIVINKNRGHFYLGKHSTKPIPSLLHDFSAPVKIEYSYTWKELYLLANHTKDPFGNWQATWQLLIRTLVDLYHTATSDFILPPQLVQLYENSFAQPDTFSTAIHRLTIPSLAQLLTYFDTVDLTKLYLLREKFKNKLAQQLHDKLLTCYEVIATTNDHRFSIAAQEQRKLKNLALAYLVRLNSEHSYQIANHQLENANNLTDRLAALTIIANSASTQREQILLTYFHRWKDQANLWYRWLALNATLKQPDTLKRVKKILTYPEVRLQNPNTALALIRTFVSKNLINFHAPDGSGYQFLQEQVLRVDKFNSQLAASLLEPLLNIKPFNSVQEQLIQQTLLYMSRMPALSANLYEMITTRLGHSSR